MTKIHGIVTTREGKYVKATLVHTSKGWEIQKTDTWDCDNVLKRFMLLSEAISLGIETHWIRSGFSGDQVYATASNSEWFTACTHQAHLLVHYENLEMNLQGVYPDDMYLCTIPLYMHENAETSFISIFEEAHSWKTGIIINKKLQVVYTIPKTESTISSFIARLERYWPTLNTGNQFPRIVFTFNNQTIQAGDHFTVYRLKLPLDTISSIKACGIAFCGIDTTQTAFKCAIRDSGFRKFRTMLGALSSLVVLGPLLFYGLLLFLNNQQRTRISQYESTYNQILSNNKEIRDLFSEGENLAEKLTRIEKFSSNPTRWSQFLHYLGTSKPAKLYFEHLGSDPVKGADNKIRILLSGWAENETIVTELIKNLNSSELVINTSLSSMERDEKQKNFCKFKILCTLLLSNN